MCGRVYECQTCRFRMSEIEIKTIKFDVLGFCLRCNEFIPNWKEVKLKGE